MPVLAPEPGQHVLLRRRRCVVREVRRGRHPPHEHLVVALDLDAADDADLTVVWELEPGARLLDPADVPARTRVRERSAALADTDPGDLAIDPRAAPIRAAVELLLGALDCIDRERGRALLADLDAPQLYRAAVAVILRLLFLRAAEARGLLGPLDQPVYASHYAATTLRDQLERRAARHGEQALARSHGAWCRLLALTRLVHAGCAHDALRLGAHGGALFDPDLHPVLEGRRCEHAPKDTCPEEHVDPPPIDDRTVLHLLRALDRLDDAAPGRPPPVELLGSAYERSLDHTAARATTPVLGLRGGRGREPRIALDALERHAADPDLLLEHLHALTGRSREALRRALARSAASSPAERRRLRRACAGDEALCARLAPWAPLLRRDARGLPHVIPAGDLYITRSPGRRRAGAHYTPPELAASIVRHTLAALLDCHDRARPPAALLERRICDLAMGCGAFLLAACRDLGARVHAGWQAAGTPGSELDARRQVIANCLFGVDRDPLAVELARLSLWLEAARRDVPFSSLDHALVCGDSLLGLGAPAQLEHLDIDPTRGAAHNRALTPFLDRPALARALAGEPSRGGLTLAELRILADVVTGAALQATSVAADESADAASLVARVLACPSLAGRLALVGDALCAALAGHAPAEARPALFRALADLAARQLGRGPDGSPRVPLHWPLVFPGVLLRDGAPGFDAVVGNPPFLGGQKITGALGRDYREYLLRTIAGGRRGSADLCAYFFLRAAELTRPSGQIGLVATNTIAQGDTREVGLDRLTAAGLEIVRALPSVPWPGEANLEVAHVWLRKGPLPSAPAPALSPALSTPGRVAGRPYRLRANAGRSFIGSYVLGLGFVLAPAAAAALLARAPNSRDVLFPYINGDDLNSTVDQSPTRWVIDFRDRPLARAPGSAHSCAEDYPDCLEIVRARVYPERQRNHRESYRTAWWHHAEKRPLLYRSIAGLGRVLLRALTSKHHAFAFAPTGWVYDQTCPVYLFDDDAHFALLQSTLHHAWSLQHGASLETRPRYTPSDCFETFPFPPAVDDLAALGGEYDGHRRALMRATQKGLTATYNRFHDPGERGSDIARLRELHLAIDRAVARAYGWCDLDLDHGFHHTAHGLRFTLGEPARRELLDRLLALNHARHAEEVAAGPDRSARRVSAPRARGRAPGPPPGSVRSSADG